MKLWKLKKILIYLNNQNYNKNEDNNKKFIPLKLNNKKNNLNIINEFDSILSVSLKLKSLKFKNNINDRIIYKKFLVVLFQWIL